MTLYDFIRDIVLPNTGRSKYCLTFHDNELTCDMLNNPNLYLKIWLNDENIMSFNLRNLQDYRTDDSDWRQYAKEFIEYNFTIYNRYNKIDNFLD